MPFLLAIIFLSLFIIAVCAVMGLFQIIGMNIRRWWWRRQNRRKHKRINHIRRLK